MSETKCHLRFVRRVAVVLLLITQDAVCDVWSNEERLSGLLGHRHHWGQPGQAMPNNGWSSYAILRYDLGASKYVQMQRQNGWLLAQVRLKSTDKTAFEAISIPRVGIFYRGNGVDDCISDPLERVGLFGELALFYLSWAYENGPLSIEAKIERNIKGRPTEIRFLHGVLRLKSRWKASVAAVPTAAGHIQVDILADGGKGPMHMRVEWLAQVDEPIVDDDESLSEWQACWSGCRTLTGEEGGDFQYYFAQKNQVETFGDIRRNLIEYGR